MFLLQELFTLKQHNKEHSIITNIIKKLSHVYIYIGVDEKEICFYTNGGLSANTGDPLLELIKLVDLNKYENVINFLKNSPDFIEVNYKITHCAFDGEVVLLRYYSDSVAFNSIKYIS